MATAANQAKQTADAPPVDTATALLSISPSGGPLSPGLWSPPQKQRPRSLIVPVSPHDPSTQQVSLATRTMLGAFNPRTVGRTVWLFYSRPGAPAADELLGQGGAPIIAATQATTVGKIGLRICDSTAHIEQIEVYSNFRGHQLGPEMLADLEILLLDDDGRERLLGCGPINELRLLALEDAERHGKLEALYHKCGFRTSGAARFECDTDHTYRHVPMAKTLEPVVFVCIPRSLALSQQEQAASAEDSRHTSHGMATASAEPDRSTPDGSRSTYPGQESCISSDTPSEPGSYVRS